LRPLQRRVTGVTLCCFLLVLEERVIHLHIPFGMTEGRAKGFVEQPVAAIEHVDFLVQLRGALCGVCKELRLITVGRFQLVEQTIARGASLLTKLTVEDDERVRDRAFGWRGEEEVSELVGNRVIVAVEERGALDVPVLVLVRVTAVKDEHLSIMFRMNRVHKNVARDGRVFRGPEDSVQVIVGRLTCPRPCLPFVLFC
jgi:hypothetical protein